MEGTSAIKIASFNLKRATVLPGAHSWKNRRDMVTRLLRDSGAAIIGVQELLPSMKQDIRRQLGDYSIFGLGRTRHLDNEHSAILLRNSGLTPLDSQTFWLSKHPEKCGSRAYFAVFPRICTVCEVYVEEWQRKIRVYNTHFDHICGPARTLGVQIILEHMHKLNAKERLPVILMGDLNAKPDSKPIRILTENRHGYPDIHLNNLYSSPCARPITTTYHGFSGRCDSRPIDYIFVSDDFAIEDVYVETSRFDGRFPSDHYPLVADLRLKTT